MSIENKKRAIRSFVIRAGRMSDSQREALSSYRDRYGLCREMGTFNNLEAFGREAPVVLEIGFGMGTSLVTMASQHPECNYVGVEVHPPGVANIFKLIVSEGLENLRIYQTDAVALLKEDFTPSSLSTVQIYFPDPWHKKRHNKRRIIQPEFLELLRSRMKPGGTLHLATDWWPYAEYMMEVVTAAEGWRNQAGEGEWSEPGERPQTKFEQRGERLGHGVWDLIFVRN